MIWRSVGLVAALTFGLLMRAPTASNSLRPLVVNDCAGAKSACMRRARAKDRQRPTWRRTTSTVCRQTRSSICRRRVELLRTSRRWVDQRAWQRLDPPWVVTALNHPLFVVSHPVVPDEGELRIETPPGRTRDFTVEISEAMRHRSGWFTLIVGDAVVPLNVLAAHLTRRGYSRYVDEGGPVRVVDILESAPLRVVAILGSYPQPGSARDLLCCRSTPIFVSSGRYRRAARSSLIRTNRHLCEANRLFRPDVINVPCRVSPTMSTGWFAGRCSID
jgi:hypothetical protein